MEITPNRGCVGIAIVVAAPNEYIAILETRLEAPRCESEAAEMRHGKNLG
jgi:hypothetical protein